MRYLLILAALPVLAAQPALTLSLPASTVMQGNTIPMALTLSGSAGQNIYGWQATPVLPTGFTISNLGAPGSATTTAQDTILPANGTYMGVGFNPSTQAVTSVALADGVVANFAVVVAPNAPLGAQTITLTNPLAADASGNAIAISTISVGITVVPANHCDLNSDGKVDGSDANLVYLGYTGKSCPLAAGCNVLTMRQVMSAVPVSLGGSGLACPF